MKVIVTGSLGNISKPLAEELIKKGHSVTVISSKPEKQQEIEALGATAVIGSLEDISFLVSVFTGADAVYAMVPPNLNVPDTRAYYRKIGGSYAQAIKQSGMKRVVHLSSMGAHLNEGTGLILGSHDVEGILDELSEVAITHLRPGYFYYNLLNFAGMIKGMGMIGANYGGDDKIIMVSPKDIAAAAAEEIETTAAGRQTRYIASGEYTGNEAAGILGASIGKPDLKWIVFTDEQAQGGMAASGMPMHIVANFVEMGASLHSGILRQDYDLHQPIVLGKVTLEEFAKEFAAAF